MSDENNILLAIMAEVREALGTPENVGLGHHARNVVAEAQAVREDLAALWPIAQKWNDVPWETIYGVVYGIDNDCLDDLRTWYLMHAPKGE